MTVLGLASCVSGLVSHFGAQVRHNHMAEDYAIAMRLADSPGTPADGYAPSAQVTPSTCARGQW